MSLVELEDDALNATPVQPASLQAHSRTNFSHASGRPSLTQSGSFVPLLTAELISAQDRTGLWNFDWLTGATRAMSSSMGEVSERAQLLQRMRRPVNVIARRRLLRQIRQRA